MVLELGQRTHFCIDFAAQNACSGIVDKVLSGFTSSIFAYGATGAGKTFTMFGTRQDPGIMSLRLAGTEGVREFSIVV